MKKIGYAFLAFLGFLRSIMPDQLFGALLERWKRRLDGKPMG